MRRIASGQLGRLQLPALEARRGEFIIAGGVVGALVIYIGALRHDRGRR